MGVLVVALGVIFDWLLAWGVFVFARFWRLGYWRAFSCCLFVVVLAVGLCGGWRGDYFGTVGDWRFFGAWSRLVGVDYCAGVLLVMVVVWCAVGW